MSQWTHVNGSIRIDALRFPGMPNPDLKAMFKTASYEDDRKAFNECNVPTGSEGSIEVLIWENPFPNALSAYTVSFFGDLRDYEDENEIVKWFTDIVENKGLMIRDAIISIKIEYQDDTAYGVDDDSKVVKLK